MGIREASIDNENLKFEFLDYNLKDKICENGQCSLGIKKKIRIKISYKEGVDISSVDNSFVLNNIMGDVRIYYKMPICQRATILHTEECKGNYCSGMGYKPDGAMGTSTITYGKLGN